MRRRTPLERLGALALGGAAAFLVPWILHLDQTLPEQALADNWRLTWVGLDGAIAAGLSGTVALSLARDRRSGPVGVATATLMLADAWFDICTSSPGSRWWAVASACCEVPLAVLCLVYATRPREARAEAVPLSIAVGSPSDPGRRDGEDEPGEWAIHEARRS